MDVLGHYPASTYDEFIKELNNSHRKAMSPLAYNFIQGKIVNTYDGILKILVTLPVSIRDNCVETHFIVDTGSFRTYITRSVLNALDVPELRLSTEVVKIKINGVETLVELSDIGLNIVGMDFMDRVGIEMSLNMKNNTVTFNFN
jgi:hypothetical protein